MAKTDCTELQRAIYDMAVNIGSRPGVEGLEDVIAEIRKDFPIFRRDDIVEAISEATSRGERETEDLERKLRAITREARGITKLKEESIPQFLEYLATGKIPPQAKVRPRGGFEIEQLRQTLANLKKWVNTSDPAMVKALTEKLKALDQQLESGEVEVDEARQTQFHADVQALQDQINAMQESIGDAKTIKSLEEKAEVLRQHLAAGTVPETKARRERGTGPADLLRNVIDDLKREIAGSPPAQAQRLTKAKAALEEKIRTGNIAPTPRRARIRTPELDQQQYEVDVLRNRLREMRLDAAPKTPLQQFRNILNFTLPIKAGGDFSMAFNQAGRRLLGHWIDGTRTLLQTLAAMTDQTKIAKINRDLMKHPLMPTFYEAGFRLSGVPGVSLGPTEEMYYGSLLERLPVIKQFAQAFPTFINIVRVGAMVDFANNWTVTGTPTLEEAKMIVKGVNQFTGRGTFGKRDNPGRFLETVMWAPRLVASHVQSVLAFPLFQTRGAARAYFAAEYARWIAGTLAFLFLGWLDGWEIDWHGTSSNFLGLKKDNVTINPNGGAVTVISLIGRHLFGVTTNAETGEQKATGGGIVPLAQMTLGLDMNPLVEKGKLFTAQSLKDMEFNFFDWKVYPPIASVAALVRQEKFGFKRGEPITVQGELLDAVNNLTWRDIYDVNTKSNLGVPDAIFAGLCAFTGMKVNIYDEK